MFKPLRMSRRMKAAKRKARNIAARRSDMGEMLAQVHGSNAQYDLSSTEPLPDNKWKKYDREILLLYKIASSVVLELLPHFDNNLNEVASYLSISRTTIERWLTDSGAIQCLPKESGSVKHTPEAQLKRRKVMNFFMEKYPEPFVQTISTIQRNNKHKINVDYLKTPSDN